jgi:hypothetical protein
MEKGKAKASGSRGIGSHRRSRGDQDALGNNRSQNVPQAASREERVNNQLLTHQDTSGRREGRTSFGSDIFEDPFFKDSFFTRPFGEPFRSSGLFGANGTFSDESFAMGHKLLAQLPFKNPPSVGEKEHNFLLHWSRCSDYCIHSQAYKQNR